MRDDSACPCEALDHPRLIFNPPGQGVITYRVGDFLSFREALLLSRPGETELSNWRPGASGDLAVQMIEWWAYLADVLTFYNERVANQAYLRTADLPESIKRLIQILGYRPRPGIGATGVVAALLTGHKPVTLGAGFQVQSKPGPGQTPQTFELETKTTIAAPDVVVADPPPNPALIQPDGANAPTVLLKGTVSTVKAADQLLLIKRGWDGSKKHCALVLVKDVKPEKDAHGRTNTRVTLQGPLDLPADALAADYRLLRSTQSSHAYQYITDHVIAYDHIHLESVKRDLKVGDPFVIDNPGLSPSDLIVSASLYEEYIWYANATSYTNPGAPPDPAKTPPIAVPHSRVEFMPHLSSSTASAWDANRGSLLVRYGWQDVGRLIATPAQSFGGTAGTLIANAPSIFPPCSGQPVLLEDALGGGATALATTGADLSTLQLTNISAAAGPLAPPLSVLFDLLTLSRGKTVPNELLGSGDASLAGQEYVLQKAPLTYLLSGDSTSGDNYKSTLRVWVDGIEWVEAASFYAQPADARVFVTREDEDGKTHVLFGDGVNGARLTTGVNNVVATYRYGSGASAPDRGALSLILKPQPNLKAIHNPVPVGGGADPDPPQQIRRYAPRSVLTFGRAVSADDYETVAAQTPGVARARAYWAWDAAQQRTLVKIYVGDDDGAVAAAKVALAGAADPNRPVSVAKATVVPVALSLSLSIDPSYIAADLIAAVRAALLDADAGLFGANAIRIGQAVYRSQIYEACLRVPGVVAVHGLSFTVDRGSGFVPDSPDYRHDPGEDGVYQLTGERLAVSAEDPQNA
jgi:hypothetical protein